MCKYCKCVNKYRNVNTEVKRVNLGGISLSLGWRLESMVNLITIGTAQLCKCIDGKSPNRLLAQCALPLIFLIYCLLSSSVLPMLKCNDADAKQFEPQCLTVAGAAGNTPRLQHHLHCNMLEIKHNLCCNMLKIRPRLQSFLIPKICCQGEMCQDKRNTSLEPLP